MELNSYKPTQQQRKQLDLLIKLLKELQDGAVTVYVAGGYGLDALYGQLTRDHRDLDLYIHEADQEALERVLNDYGFHPTGNFIGEAGKKEYANKEFSDQFTIECGVVESGLKFLSETEQTKLLSTEPLGSLGDFKIWTPTLTGFKKMIEINNILAAKNNYPEYTHKGWIDTILEYLDKKFIS